MGLKKPPLTEPAQAGGGVELIECPEGTKLFCPRGRLSSPDQASTSTYPSDPSPTNIARTLSESSGAKVSIRSGPARPSSSFSV